MAEAGSGACLEAVLTGPSVGAVFAYVVGDDKEVLLHAWWSESKWIIGPATVMPRVKPRKKARASRGGCSVCGIGSACDVGEAGVSVIVSYCIAITLIS